MPDAWDIKSDCNEATIAVFDTDIYFGQSGITVADGAYDAVNDRALTASSLLFDGHGTVVSYLATNETYGVARNAKVLPVKVGSKIDEFTEIYDVYSIVRAYEYISNNSFSNLNVINVSVGLSLNEISLEERDEIQAGVTRAWNKGVLTVAAVGNDGSSLTYYPAGCAHAIGVGSVGSSNAHSDFSNHNASVDIVAPGEVLPTPTIAYYPLKRSGTSFSCPLVAGTAAMLFAANPGITPSRVESILTSTATELGAAGRDDYYGYGLVNAFEAVSRYTASTSLAVDRLSGDTRYDTARLIARYGRASSYYAVVVSGSDSAWPDALCASGLAGVRNAPVLTTASDALSSQTRATLIDLNVRYVYIVGGSSAVSSSVMASIGNISNVTTVRRVSGADRYKTAEAVYNTVASTSWVHPTGGLKHSKYATDHVWKNGSKKKMALLATGTDFPDAMVASSLSAYAHFPIFLVQADGTLTAETKTILRNGGFDEVAIVGGGIHAAGSTAAGLVDPADIVGAPVYGKPGETFKAGENWYLVIVGDTRYETAEEVFNRSYREGMPISKVLISSGRSPVDALPAGALKCPILLADDSNHSVAKSVARNFSNGIYTLTPLGGVGVLSDSVINEVIKGWRLGQGGLSRSLDEDSVDIDTEKTGSSSETVVDFPIPENY